MSLEPRLTRMISGPWTNRAYPIVLMGPTIDSPMQLILNLTDRVRRA